MQRFGRQHVNESQTRLRSAQNQFYTTVPLILDRGNSKRLVLIISELLLQFVNTLTAYYKYSRENMDNYSQQVPRPISLEPKTFSGVFLAFLKSTLNLE